MVIVILLIWSAISTFAGLSVYDDYFDELVDKTFKVKHIIFLPVTIFIYIILAIMYGFVFINSSKFLIKIKSFLDKEL